jgi:hypothetical protein
MPLVDLVTDLKSLKYGKDTPGGGYSGQPYIQAKIPDGLEPKSPDFILRGGYLTVGDSLTDIKRLTKMFFDLKSPNGLFFIAKQNVLSNSAVRTQTSGILNEGIYTPLNTLAQAGVIAFGGHLDKQGINPFAQTGAYAIGSGLYNSVVKPSQPLEENRLVSLYTAVSESVGINNWNFSGVNLNVGDNNILSYRGGPGAPLGVGTTNIRYADQRTGKNNPKYIPYEDYIVKSVLNNKQEGGLKIDTGNGTKTWIKAGAYFDGNAKNVYFVNNDNFLNGLPSNNVNTPQSASLSNIPDGSKTWTPKQNNPDSLKYLKSINNKGVSGTYIKLTSGSSTSVLDSFYNIDGQLGAYYNFSVYEPIIPNNTWPKNSKLINANNTFTYNQEDIIQSNVNPPTGDHLSPKIQDFRKVLRDRLGETSPEGKKATNLGATPNTPNYSGTENKSIEKRVNIGSIDGAGPGSRANKSYASYTKGVQVTNGNGDPAGTVGAQDLINALSIYRSNGVKPNSTEYPVNDLVKFRIAAIDNNNPQFKTFMHFRAFIDSFNDSYNASWGDVRYLGRGEKFYNYNGFDRTVTLSFTVAAQSKQELIPMYKKLNYLASNLAPDYSPFGYMRGPLVQLTVGGYLHEQVGFITALAYDIPNDSPWEIGINDQGNDDPSVKELPHRINISSFSFTPIHNFVPQKQGLGFNSLGLNDSSDGATGFVTRYGNQRYIALTAGGVSNYDDYAGEVFTEREEEPTVGELAPIDAAVLRNE